MCSNAFSRYLSVDFYRIHVNIQNKSYYEGFKETFCTNAIPLFADCL